MIKNKVIATLVGLTSSAAVATTYTVDVSVTSQVNQSLLQITQSQEMSFPEITVAKESAIGSACYADGSSNTTTKTNNVYTSNANSLCPRLTGKMASFSVKGHPYARIYVRVVAEEQIKNGLSFNINASENTQTLNHSGNYARNINGQITLVDPEATSTGDLSFNYDFEAYYQ